jgi:hypothetical protein
MRKSALATAILLGSLACGWSVWGQNMPGHVLGSPTGGGMSSNPLPMGGNSDDYEAGLRLIRHEEYADAIPHLERAFVTHSHSAALLNDLGLAHRKLGHYSTSMGFIRQALKEDPNNDDAYEDLGELYLTLHDLPSAQAQMTELARVCPSGCDNRTALSKSIAAFEAANPGSGAPASTAPANQSGADPTRPSGGE